jgi:mannosyltransferase
MKILQLIKSNYLLISILIIGTVLRLYGLDFQSVWLDEIHTLNNANPANSISEVYASILIADPHPPLYFYLVHYLFIIFGYTPFVARFFSVVAGIYAIFAIYRLGKELANKEVGLMAALLLSLNGYHIYYSQEARPYAMMCLFTILAFIYLVRFIKMPTRRNAVLYGVFTALMLYGHFFSLFTLVSHMAILAFFTIISKKTDRKAFVTNTLIGGLVMALLFIPPSLKVFIAANRIKEFWIPFPTPDVYTLIFREFFGNSEIVMGLIGFIILLYFVRLSKEKPSEIRYESVLDNKTVLSFIVLMPWIAIVIFIPLVRSYTSIPMIISRYFINLLPAILIIISLGLFQFKNQIVRLGLISLLFVFLLTDLIVVKKYYKTVNKTQFREVSKFIIDNNKDNEPVVTSLKWYFPYFLHNKTHHYTIVDRNLDAYVQEMAQDSAKVKSFWYVDAHIRPYLVTPATQQFLDANFLVENSIDLYDTWTKHYILKSEAKFVEANIKKFEPLKTENGDSFGSAVETFEHNAQGITLSGWAFFDGQDATTAKVDVVLIGNGSAKLFRTNSVSRKDVTTYFKSSFNLDESGYSAFLPETEILKGKFQIGILLHDPKTGKEGLKLTDKTVEK